MINVLKCPVHIGNKLCVTQGNKHLRDWLKVTGGVGGCISHHDFWVETTMQMLELCSSPNSSLSHLSKRTLCLKISPCLVSHQFLTALCFYFQIQLSDAWLLFACSYCRHRLWSTELSQWLRSAQDMLWKHRVCRLGKSSPSLGRENTLWSNWNWCLE